MTRKKYMIANWKMNQSQASIRDFFGQFNQAKDFNCVVGIAPQYLHIPLCLELANNTGTLIGTQDCAPQNEGALTGQVSPMAIKEMGPSFVIIGHSERRQINGETHHLLNQKLHQALNNQLDVIFCIGETLKERESGQTLSTIELQLKEGLKGLTAPKQNKVLLAYEPVWAIGTGKVATPNEAKEVHQHIRQFLRESLDLDGAAQGILYGGSVKPSNVEELLATGEIEGGLVGGASLNPSDFEALCMAASK